MDLQFSFDFSEVQKLVLEIRRNLTTEHLLKDAPQFLKEDVSNQFLTQGDPQWEPLSQRRFDQRARRNSANLLILIDTGSLLRSWIDTGSSGHVESFDDEGLTFGTSDRRAGLLHGGGVNDEGLGVPARPIAFRENVLELIAASVIDNLLET